MRSAHQFYDELRKWATGCEEARGLILGGSRANSHAHTDVLSDFDIDLFVDDWQPFLDSDGWLEHFGSILVRSPLRPVVAADEHIFRTVIYADGLRVDYDILPIGELPRVRHAPDDYGFENRYREPTQLGQKDSRLTRLPTVTSSNEQPRRLGRSRWNSGDGPGNRPALDAPRDRCRGGECLHRRRGSCR